MINHRISSTIPSIKDMMVNTSYGDDDHDDDGDSLDDDSDYDVAMMTQDRLLNYLR